MCAILVLDASCQSRIASFFAITLHYGYVSIVRNVATTISRGHGDHCRVAGPSVFWYSSRCYILFRICLSYLDISYIASVADALVTAQLALSRCQCYRLFTLAPGILDFPRRCYISTYISRHRIYIFFFDFSSDHLLACL